MSKCTVRGNLGVTVAILAMLAFTGLARAAAYEHPQFYSNAEKEPGGQHVPFFSWGTVRLENTELLANDTELAESERAVSAECVNLMIGSTWNETEPGKTTERAYGEILEWTATGYAKEGQEPGSRCRWSQGYETWMGVEPPLSVKYELGQVAKGGGGTEERLVVSTNAEKGAKRLPPTVPWKWEATGELGSHGRETYKLKMGIGSSSCFPGFEVTEQPNHTTEKVYKAAPAGCVRMDLIIPAIGFEEELQGTLTFTLAPGIHSGLTPTTAALEGAGSGSLESIIGKWSVTTPIKLKMIGFQDSELLTFGVN
jgi:hypothetical protein